MEKEIVALKLNKKIWTKAKSICSKDNIAYFEYIEGLIERDIKRREKVKFI